MNTIDAIKTRRSIRRFKETAVPHSLLEQIVSAASFAPSWKNSQLTLYIVIEDFNLKKAIADTCCSEHNACIIKPAPLLVATTLITGRSGYERDGSFSTIRGDAWQAFDCGIACQTFCLAAKELGLDTVILGLYDFEKASALIQIPDGQQLMALIAVGYGNETPDAPMRKPVETLLTYR